MAGPQRYAPRRTAREVESGRHRQVVGGLWDEIGTLQFEFMVEAGGLTPDMTFLDVGCGCLRGGVHFIRYLEPGNYYGLDLNPSLLRAGLELELPRYGLEDRLAAERLLCTDDFGAWRFDAGFDRALALSVWTHVPLNDLQRSLFEVGRVLEPDGAFFATVFLCEDESRLLDPIEHEPSSTTSHRDRDPFHYSWADIEHACRPLDLEPELIGRWGHPRGQQMVKVTRGRSA